MKILDHRSRSANRGTALISVAVAMAGLAATSLAVLQLSLSTTGEQRSTEQRLAAQYAAEAALAAAIVDLQAGGDGAVFTKGAPLRLGRAEAWVGQSFQNGGIHGLLAGASLGPARFGAELVTAETTSSLFQYGAFGDISLTMDSNAQLDSYDSEDGAYAATSGSGSSAYDESNAALGSNNDVEASQNVKIWGDILCGPSGSVTLLGNTQHSGSWGQAGAVVELPDIVLPSVVQAGTINTGTNSTTVIPSGDLGFTDFVVGKNAKVVVTGPATIVCGTFEIKSGSEVIIDDSNGPVEFFVEEDFLINSNTFVGSLDLEPADVAFNLLTDNIIDPVLEVNVDSDEMAFDSNAVIHGTVYAPYASVLIDSNFELFGSVVAKELHLDSNSKIHYDEALADSAKLSTSSWEIVGWRLSGTDL
jgi:hypothetical protein